MSILNSHMSKILLLACLIICCSSASVLPAYAKSTTAKKPNVIVIVADQMRRSALGLWRKPEYQGLLNGVSDPVITPNLDKLANDGVVFTQAIANFPLCSPFRGMLMSGRYPNNNGINNNTRSDRDIGLRQDIPTLTDILFDAGYNTALIGKAHWSRPEPMFDKAGNYKGTTAVPGGYFIERTKYDTYIPPGRNRFSIEYWLQSLGHMHNDPLIYSNDPVAVDGKKDGEAHQPGGFTVERGAEYVIEYLKNNRQQRDSSKPFALLFPIDPPHNPYAKMSDTDEDIYNTYYKDKTFSMLLNRPNVSKEKAAKHVRYYFSMITQLDREVGRVIETLKEEGLYDNTLILFTADHGEMMGSQNLLAKNYVYEESLSIPLIMSYPNKLSHKVDDLLISVPDYMPTLLGLLGLSNKIPNDIDGVDYSKLILGQKYDSDIRPNSSLYYGKQNELGVRTKRYTYAVNKSGKIIALYDNVADPYQMNLLSHKQLDKKDWQHLKSELGYWLNVIGHDWAESKINQQLISYPVTDI